MALAIAHASPAAVGPTEYEVKAAFLFNFISFTDWPPSAFATPSSPIHICVVAHDPFGSGLERMIAGERVGQHPLTLQHPEAPADLADCQVLFVPAAVSPTSLLRTTGRRPVLTVGESDAFWRGGGIVNFVLERGRVRFDVNETAAEQRGLRLNAKVLRVARRVI